MGTLVAAHTEPRQPRIGTGVQVIPHPERRLLREQRCIYLAGVRPEITVYGRLQDRATPVRVGVIGAGIIGTNLVDQIE